MKRRSAVVLMMGSLLAVGGCAGFGGDDDDEDGDGGDNDGGDGDGDGEG